MPPASKGAAPLSPLCRRRIAACRSPAACSRRRQSPPWWRWARARRWWPGSGPPPRPSSSSWSSTSASRGGSPARGAGSRSTRTRLRARRAFGWGAASPACASRTPPTRTRQISTCSDAAPSSSASARRAPHSGQDTLAGWLKHPAPVTEVRERQAAVAELAPRVELREDLAVLGAEARRAVDSRPLAEWAAAAPVRCPARPPPRRRPGVSGRPSPPSAGWGLGLWGSLPFYLAAGLVLALALLSRAVSDRVLAGHRPPRPRPPDPHRDLRPPGRRALRGAPARASARGPLRRGPAPRPAHRPAPPLARGPRLQAQRLLRARGVPAALGPSAGGRRRRLAAALRPARPSAWLSVLGELEALVSLGGYAFENPDDPFPVLEEAGPLLHARGLGHPLLPESRPCATTCELDAERQMLVVTGSNMSGKSTLLRTVGSQRRAGPGRRAGAGGLPAPVTPRGGRLDPGPGLAAGRGVALLRRDQADPPGDGPREGRRRPPSSCSTRSSTARTRPSGGWGRRPWCARCSTVRAIGLVTSHDLALAEIAASLAPRAANVHFEDHLEGDRIAFDYRLSPARWSAATRSGSCARSGSRCRRADPAVPWGRPAGLPARPARPPRLNVGAGLVHPFNARMMTPPPETA